MQIWLHFRRTAALSSSAKSRVSHDRKLDLTASLACARILAFRGSSSLLIGLILEACATASDSVVRGLLSSSDVPSALPFWAAFPENHAVAFRVALDSLDESAERDLWLLALLGRATGNKKLGSKGIGGGGKAGTERDRVEEEAPLKEWDEERVEAVTRDES